MKVKSESEDAQSSPTLSDPMDCGPPGSPIPGILQARPLEWGAIAFSSGMYSTGHKAVYKQGRKGRNKEKRILFFKNMRDCFHM